MPARIRWIVLPLAAFLFAFGPPWTETYTGPEGCSTFQEFKGEGDNQNVQPKASYEYQRPGLINLDQDDFGANTCFPTAAAMSFTYLEAATQTNLVPKFPNGDPDFIAMMNELMPKMGHTEADGTNPPGAVRGIAEYLRQHDAAGKFTITHYTEAPKNGDFPNFDELEKEKSLSGTAYDMKRGKIQGIDVLKEMKAGEDVLITTPHHVVDLAGMDGTKNANGNYDVAVAEPGSGTTIGGQITPDGKLIVGDKTHDIQDIVAVSPVKKEE